MDLERAAVLDKVWSIVDRLPQRDLIDGGDAREWVRQTVDAHGEQAIWHAIRLNGFGGSEIGVLARNALGVRADHQASAHDIVQSKLMMRAPLETSSHMTRGHENEEFHARKFWDKYGAKRDLEAYEALKSFQGSHVWMRYSPDDVVLMPLISVIEDGQSKIVATPGEMHRWLIDYKAPSKVDEDPEIAYQYACQLTQGAILCGEGGVELEGMMLSQFDWANWCLKDDVVSWNEDMAGLVLKAGDHYWDCVMRGEVPPYIRKPHMEGVDEYKKALLSAAQMYANLAAMADAAQKRADQVRTILLQPLDGVKLEGNKIAFGEGRTQLTMSAQQVLDKEAVSKIFSEEQLLSCSGKWSYNADAMESYLRAQGAEMKQFRKFDLDASKVLTLADSLGMDADALMKERLVLSPDKAIKAEMMAFIEENYPLSSLQVSPSPAEADVPAEGAAP